MSDEPLIISRKNALELGLKRYFIGKTCSRGHVAERYVCDCKCVVCEREKSAAKYRKNPKEINERHRQWVANNKDRAMEISRKWQQTNKEKIAERVRRFKAKNPTYMREHNRKRTLMLRVAKQTFADLGVNLEDIISAASI